MKPLRRPLDSHGHRFLVHDGNYLRPRKNETVCTVGRDLTIEHSNLENYCFKLLTPTQYDLVVLAGSVAFADRCARRHTMSGWARRISLAIEVHEPNRWEQTQVVQSLVEALRFVTGDVWEFSFLPRKSPSNFLSTQNHIQLTQSTSAVLPFSNGLDSFANYRSLVLEEPQANPIAITTWSQSVACQAEDWLGGNHQSQIRRLKIPFRMSTSRHPEPTYRSRTFVFYTLAALAAHSSGADRVVIPESGQGSLGPSLATFGREWPHRGSHPGFTNRLAAFFNTLDGWNISFEHPHLWSTKGEVLQTLREHDSLRGWENTKSCVRDTRDVSLDGMSIQCGVCTGCLLRRLALFAGGLESDAERYLWDNLSAPTIEGSILKRSARTTSPNDRDIAVHAVLDHQVMATATDPNNQTAVNRVAYEVAEATKETPAQTVEKLRTLLLTHRTQWRDFLQALRPESWVRTVVANC